MKSTSECIKCNDSEIEEVSKAEVYIVCHRTGKRYVYGQMIPCDSKDSNGKRV